MTDARRVLNGINLNLLLVLDALLKHNNATRAAEELGVTPSAVSHSLRELRAVFEDPLFVRTRYGLTPTARASALATDLGLALNALDEIMQRGEEFDPATSARRCRVACADDAVMTLLPSFVERVARQAPGITIEFRPHGLAPLEALEAGSIDLVLVLRQDLPAWCDSAEFYRDDVVCLVRDGHPEIHDELTRELYTAYQHILIAPEGYGASLADGVLAREGIQREYCVYSYSFPMAFEFVARTDAILSSPRKVARVASKRYGLRILEPPFSIPEFSIDVVWHLAQDDAALRWLREQLLAGEE